MGKGASHRFEEHTGEVRLVLCATEARDMFVEAGRALAELMRGARPAEPTETVRLDLHAAGPAELLVEWIDELVFQSELRKVVFERFDVRLDSPGHLRAIVEGGPPEALQTPVKAATLHGLAWDQQHDGVTATVILDV